MWCPGGPAGAAPWARVSPGGAARPSQSLGCRGAPAGERCTQGLALPGVEAPCQAGTATAELGTAAADGALASAVLVVRASPRGTTSCICSPGLGRRRIPQDLAGWRGTGRECGWSCRSAGLSSRGAARAQDSASRQGEEFPFPGTRPCVVFSQWLMVRDRAEILHERRRRMDVMDTSPGS